MSKSRRPRNDKNQKHGLWERYWGTGKLWFKSFYHNGKLVGYEEYYFYSNGKLKEKNYHI